MTQVGQDKSGLVDLLGRVQAATGPERELDEAVARALGYHTRLVTGLGLNGRTPGSYRWFAPGPQPPGLGAARPPNFTGPRGKSRAAALLQALIANPHGKDLGRPELPSGVRPADLTGPQSQHSDGEDA